MSRRNAVWIALTVGMATVVALMIVGRLRRRPVAAGTDWAPDPGPHSVATGAAPAATSTGDRMADATASAAPSQPGTELRPEGDVDTRVEPAEQPLAMWIRLTIVAVALVAFLAISLIAKSV